MLKTDSKLKKTVAYDGWFLRFGKPPNEDIPDAPVLYPWVCPIPILLLHQDGEAGVDAVDLPGGKDRSFGKDLLQVLHGYGPDPSESFDVEDGPRVREDDGAVKPEAALCARATP